MWDDLSFWTNVGLGLVAALGAWITLVGLNAALTKPKASLTLQAPDQTDFPVSDLPPLAQRILGGTLHQAGRWLFGRGSTTKLEDRLRRSGWLYLSIGDFHASRVANAIAFGLLGYVAGNVLAGSAGFSLVAALGLGVIGYLRPDDRVNDMLKRRKEALKREMAWTLDRLAAVMQTGEALGPSLGRLTDQNYDWVAGGSGALFIAVLRDISAGLASNRNDIGEMVSEIRATLPEDIPELDEFLMLVRANLEKRQPVVEQLRALSTTMRDELNNKIEELAQKSELKIVMVTSGVIVPLLLIVVGGVMLLNM